MPAQQVRHLFRHHALDGGDKIYNSLKLDNKMSCLHQPPGDKP